MRELKPFSKRCGRGQCGYASNKAVFYYQIAYFSKVRTSDDDLRGEGQMF